MGTHHRTCNSTGGGHQFLVSFPRSLMLYFNESHLETRESLIRYFARFLELQLMKVNSAFRFIRIETPILSPQLRPGSTKAAYDASKELLTSKVGPKYKLPIVLWQHGKVFRTPKRGGT